MYEQTEQNLHVKVDVPFNMFNAGVKLVWMCIFFQ